MEKLERYGAILTLMMIVFAVGLFIGRGGQAPSSDTTLHPSTTVAPQSNSSGPLFSAEPYYPYSYLIAPGKLSPQSTDALDGYTMTINNSTTAENITISYSGRAVTTMLSDGDRLYIVETSFGDDAPGYEGSQVDDGFVLVDSTGHVLKTFAL
jgi:hypothetical protein